MRPLRMRAPEGERAATPLELLFDLCFVVAVAILAADLHHGIVDHHGWEATRAYALLFVPVWWAWMSFTWFATAFDNDDVVHRLLTMAQMVGIVALAATTHDAAKGDLGAFGLAVAALRVPLIVQWVRAARADRAHAGFAGTYAAGLALGAVVWVAGSRLEPPLALAPLALAVLVDLAMPVLAVRRAPGPVFHPGHIAERYGLFALIVIGESILAIAVGLEQAVENPEHRAEVLALVASGGAIAFALWWIYFEVLGRDGLTRRRSAAFVWGYGHLLLYAAIAAVGAGVQAQLEIVAEGEDAAVLAIALPTALALLAVAGLQVSANGVGRGVAPLLVASLASLPAALAGDVVLGGVVAAVAAVVAAAVATTATAGEGAGELSAA